jgi:hypothetical protein
MEGLRFLTFENRHVQQENETPARERSVVVDPLNGTGSQTTSTTYDFSTGLPTSVTDSNLNITTSDYTNQLLSAIDPFGRPGKVTGPYVSVNINGQVSTQRRTAVIKYLDSALQAETISDLNAENDGKLRSRTTVDKLKRTVKTEHSEDGSTYSISSEIVYKNRPGGQIGSATFTRNPHRSASDPTDGWTRTTQDALGRVTEIATFAGSTQPPDTGTTGTGVTWTGSVNTNYNAEQTTVTDQAGKQRRSIVDGLGRLKTVVEDPSVLNYSTNYTYDVLGNLLQVDQGGQHRFFTYDNLSRLKTAKTLNRWTGRASRWRRPTAMTTHRIFSPKQIPTPPP